MARLKIYFEHAGQLAKWMVDHEDIRLYKTTNDDNHIVFRRLDVPPFQVKIGDLPYRGIQKWWLKKTWYVDKRDWDDYCEVKRVEELSEPVKRKRNINF